MADDFLCSSSDSFVLSPFLYCGWFTPRKTLRDLWAPWIRQDAQPKAAGFLQRCRVRFVKT